MTNVRPPALRKAAILIASLDPDAAAAMLAQMSDEHARLVRETINDLDDLDPIEQQEVIDEFFRISPLMPEKMPPGIELADSLALRLAMSEGNASIGERKVGLSHDDRQPFARLHDTDCGILASLLEREQPQIAAVVISHLPPERAAEVLAELPSRMQSQVARRLLGLDETDPEVLKEIETA